MVEIIPFDSTFGTRFSVSVDTEEEFDWAGEFSRDDHGVEAASALAQGQRFFQAAGVVPIYYVDQPIINSDVAVATLAPAVMDGSAEVGVHLHPWVTPPFTEIINRHNSYVGNLDAATERAKLRSIRDRIAARVGKTPIAYRAGRYGIGPNSYRILQEEGFRCDSSVRPLFDYSDDGGPDFRKAIDRPYWTDTSRKLIEVPLSAHFVGWGGKLMPALFKAMPSIGARTRLVTRVPLTPEGIPLKFACAMIDTALDKGTRLLSMSFHSPSLAIGHTPYVRNKADLAQLYRWFDGVFNHCTRRGVEPVTMQQILAAADAVSAS